MLAFNFGSSRGELGFGSWIKSHVETIAGSNLLIGNRRATLMTTTRRRPCESSVPLLSEAPKSYNYYRIYRVTR